MFLARGISTAVAFLLIVGILFPTVKADDLITAPLDELLPSREDIPTQWHTGSSSNITMEEPGFVEGKTVNYYKIYVADDLMNLHFSVYRFSNITSAEAYCNREIDKIEAEGGYTEVPIPEVFAVVVDYGVFEKAISWGVMSNIVFTVNVLNTYSLENPTDELVYFTNLEKDTVPEGASFLILPLFMLATLLAIIIYRRKHARALSN
jgi:hypothetical protein